MKYKNITLEDLDRFTLEQAVCYCAVKIGMPMSFVDNLEAKELLMLMTKRLYQSLEAEQLAKNVLEGTGLKLPSVSDLEAMMKKVKPDRGWSMDELSRN